MPDVLHGDVSWPGAIAVESATFTCSHGISPGTAILNIQPQPDFPDEQGDLQITDGNETVVIPGCKIDGYQVSQDESGQVVSLTIVDRRWRWRELGGINGAYNLLDPQGKLIPWSVRSPLELATLCLEAMGETGYTIDMPPGHAYPGPYFTQPFFDVGGVNPPINWVAVPPAQALQEVCDRFGRRLVYQLATDTVLITRIGEGDALPDGSIAKQGPSIKSPETPDSVAVQGAPTRYQVRLNLEPVGEDWDGFYRPIAQLSYAPKNTTSTPQINTATVVYDGTTASQHYEIFLGATAGQDPSQGVLFDYTATPGQTAAAIATAIAALINASTDPRVKGVITASASSGVLTITGPASGASMQVLTIMSPQPVPTGNSFDTALTQIAKKISGKLGDWSTCPPPLFPGCTATDRLTLYQATQLAQKTVWKCYRVTNVDVSGKGGIQVPGYDHNPLSRRQQLLIELNDVDQIVPTANDPNILDPFNRPSTVDFYAAFSKDKPAAAYGSISSLNIGNVLMYVPNNPPNTPIGSRVLTPIVGLDSYWQVITFANHVWKNGASTDLPLFTAPDLVLECAVQVRDPDTNQFDAYTRVEALPGQNSKTNPKVGYYPDVQLNVTCVYHTNASYDAYGNPTKVWYTFGNVQPLEADAILRANYYLNGLAAQYHLSGGQTIEYNGIRAINLDGAIQQVTWIVDGSGARTTASRNSEHNIYVPPYPARRRVEYLAAVKQDLDRQRFNIPELFFRV